MYKFRSFAALGISPCGMFIACLALCGCEKSEQVTTYSVPKHEALQSKEFLEQQERLHPKPRRMIGIVIPRESSQWFFKLEGNIDAVAARENDVREFLKSLRLSSAEKLEWTLPDGWKQLPGTEMRFATLVLDGQPPLEMSVTELPNRPDQATAEQVVPNLNRWRGQLSLPPIKDDDLDHQAEKLTLNGFVGYWINIIGRPRPRPASMAQPPQPPLAHSTDPGDASPNPARPRSAPGNQTTQAGDQAEPVVPKFEKPPEWSEGPSAMFAKVSLQALEGDAKVAITVTPARGDTLANVNRWRGQLKLNSLTAADLTSTAKKVEVGTISGDLYEMTNGERTILGVIVEDRGQTWFVKLDGNTPLAERERPRFETFLKSLRLE